MTSAEAFTYALTLRGGERDKEILNLLDETKRGEVKAALAALRDRPAKEIWRKWDAERKADELSAREAAKGKLDTGAEQLPRLLSNWLLERL